MQNKIFKIFPFAILFTVLILIYYKSFIHGLIPFPGDLLLSQYSPWRNTSYAGYVPGTIPTKGQYFDVVRELYPWKTLVISEIKSGKLPLWNPYNFSGTPLLANYQSQVFYPLGVIYLLFPQHIAWAIMVILQSALGLLFTYLYCRTIKLSKPASIVAAILWNFSAFATIWIEFTTVWHTILWLPLLLTFIEWNIEKRYSKTLLLGLTTLITFFLLTAGHPQDSIYTLLFAGFYAVYRFLLKPEVPFKTKFLPLLYWCISIILGFAIAGIQLIPTAELYSMSARVPHNTNNILQTMLLQWWQIPMIIIQDYFGNPATNSYIPADSYVSKAISIGVVGFFLALITIIKKQKKPFENLYFGVAIFLLLINVHSPITTLLYRFPIPILSTGTPTRNLFIFGFALSILAGYGFDSINKVKNKFILQYSILSGILLGALWIFSVIIPKLPEFQLVTRNFLTIQRSLIIASALVTCTLLGIIVTRKFKIFKYIFIVFIACECLISFTKFNPFVPSSYVFPDNQLITWLKNNAYINRYWGYGTAHIDANFATQTKTYSTDGTDPLNIRWYNALLQTSDNGHLPVTFTNRTRSDAQIKPGFGEEDLPNNHNRLRILDVTATKFIIDRNENPKTENTFPQDKFTTVASHPDGWSILQNKSAAERVFFADSMVLYSDDKDFEKKFFSPLFDPKSVIAISEKDKNALQTAPSTKSTIDIRIYQPTKIIIATNTDIKRALFISDTYTPGWKATVNGIQTPIVRADYAFRAISVPEGKNEIVFTYEPLSLKAGFALTLFGILTLLIFLIYLNKTTDTVKQPKS